MDQSEAKKQRFEFMPNVEITQTKYIRRCILYDQIIKDLNPSARPPILPDLENLKYVAETVDGPQKLYQHLSQLPFSTTWDTRYVISHDCVVEFQWENDPLLKLFGKEIASHIMEASNSCGCPPKPQASEGTRPHIETGSPPLTETVLYEPLFTGPLIPGFAIWAAPTPAVPNDNARTQPPSTLQLDQRQNYANSDSNSFYASTGQVSAAPAKETDNLAKIFEGYRGKCLQSSHLEDSRLQY